MPKNLTPFRIIPIAFIQGLLFYGLHWSVQHKVWPATDLHWLIALYAASLFVPTTLEVLARELRWRGAFTVAGIIGLFAVGLGAYAGWATGRPEEKPWDYPLIVVFYLTFAIAWFIALPFSQTWLRTNRRNFPYRDLFEFSWQNALLLAEAGVFTGVFWALLGLWAALFKVVGISFFMDLFREPVFAYPVTAIAFGYAIFLIQSRESAVLTMRRHLLGVFNWLLPLVAAIAVMFLSVLPFTGLAPLWKTGHATFLMLWLQALLILFVNAAYEDGENEPAYPIWLKSALRIAVFAMPVYAVLCAYSLSLRIDQHGWTVDRVWAALIILIVALYGLGYAMAAWPARPWMGKLRRVNVFMAWMIVALLVLVSTPLIDPKRLSVNSQLSRLASGRTSPARFDYDYLRFDLGRYGQKALTELAKSTTPDTARLASLALAKTSRWGPNNALAKEDIAKRIEVFPKGAVLEPAFFDHVNRAIKGRAGQHPRCFTELRESCLMLVIDLNRDGQSEVVVLGSWPQAVYSKIDGDWLKVGQLIGTPMGRDQIETSLQNSEFMAEPNIWSGLRIGTQWFNVQEEVRPKQIGGTKE